MAALSAGRIRELLLPYVATPPDVLLNQLSAYLTLLLKWNSFTNLTSVREPEEVVKTHFGESLFVASHLPMGRTLLDIGSGAGFPGLPIQLARMDLVVTLAESQNKKAAFLREVVRELGLSTEVWGRRVEGMPEGRRFDLVTLRAVDDPERALRVAATRVGTPGSILCLGSSPGSGREVTTIPGSTNKALFLYTGANVPHGTFAKRKGSESRTNEG